MHAQSRSEGYVADHVHMGPQKRASVDGITKAQYYKASARLQPDVSTLLVSEPTAKLRRRTLRTIWRQTCRVGDSFNGQWPMEAHAHRILQRRIMISAIQEYRSSVCEYPDIRYYILCHILNLVY
eukprot:SAG11_NODE_2545_length_3234_cov_4.296332_1_plen_125_part_00